MIAALEAPLLDLGSAAVEVLRWLVWPLVKIFEGYSWLIALGADSVHSLFDSYGYLVVFFGTLFENTLLLGLIVPGAIVVILAGINAEDGLMDPFLAGAIGTLGTIIGDTISYVLGRFGWNRFGTGSYIQRLSDQVREPLLRKGALFVLFYHFAGYTRVVGPAAAGLLRMPVYKWMIADYSGAVLWVTAYMAIGYGLGLAGISLDSTDKYFRYVEWGLLVLVMVWGYFMYRAGMRAWERHLRERAELEQQEAEKTIIAPARE